jgi:hypothetical protein
MWQAITAPSGLMIIAGVFLLAIVVTAVVIGLRTVSGHSPKARRADALRKIEEVNRAGYLDDVGTIKIDTKNRRRQPDDGQPRRPAL